MNNKITTIEAYIMEKPEEIQPMLRQIWAAIREAAPDTTEKISWGMPTFVLNGNLVHFAAEKHHVGFHSSYGAVETFAEELISYHASKSTARFPYDQEVPLELIKKMVHFRIKEQQEEKTVGKQVLGARPRYEMPDYFREALERGGVTAQYEARPPYQKNDYISWIGRAKRPETRAKRIAQMLEELRAGDRYMGMAWGSGIKLSQQPPDQ